MTASNGTYAMVAEFEAEDGVVSALRALRNEGFRHMEAFGPIPSPRIEEALGEKSRTVEVTALVCGVLGAAATYGMLYYSSVWAFPFVVGGKPFDSWPPFFVITFALGALSVVAAAFFAMLVMNRLPRLHHPVFDAGAYEGSARDRWLVAVLAEDGRYDAHALRGIFARFEPLTVEEVPS